MTTSILNLMWNYNKRGFFINKKNAPTRYRLRIFTEHKILPKAQKCYEFVKSFISTSTVLALLALYYLCYHLFSSVGFLGQCAEKWLRYCSANYVSSIFRGTRLRKTSDILIFGSMMIAVLVLPVFALAIFFVLIGKPCQYLAKILG